MKGKFSFLIYHRVTGIAAALIAYDNVKLLGQEVDHTALSFIAPVNTYYRAVFHVRSPYSTVTDFARFFGLSMSHPFSFAT